MAKNDDKYTDPELRTEIKEKVQASDKGGQPGQWSARKAQMMAQEYKKEMQQRGEEPYTTDKSEQSESQKHLSDWTKEEWQTSDGSANAKQEDGSMKRYLPKKAWENMSEEEKRETEAKKTEGGKEGKQFVSNTDTAKKARKNAQEHGGDDIEDDEEDKAKGDDADNKTSTKRGRKHKRDENGGTEKANGTQENEVEVIEGDRNDVDDGDEQPDGPAVKQAKGNNGRKRTTKAKSDVKEKNSETNKANGSNDTEDGRQTKNNENSKEADDSHGKPGSASRLPSKGQKVFWRASPGWCEGTVIEVAHSETEIDGVHAKASKDDPRIILESSKSGKKAVHKPSAVYF